MLSNPTKKEIFIAFLVNNKTDEQLSHELLRKLYDDLRETLLAYLDIELTVIRNMFSKENIKTTLGKINV